MHLLPRRPGRADGVPGLLGTGQSNLIRNAPSATAPLKCALDFYPIPQQSSNALSFVFPKILPGQWQDREESFKASADICYVQAECQCCGLVSNALSDTPASARYCRQFSANWPHPAFHFGRAGARRWHHAFNLARQRWPQGRDKAWLVGTLGGAFSMQLPQAADEAVAPQWH